MNTGYGHGCGCDDLAVPKRSRAHLNQRSHGPNLGQAKHTPRTRWKPTENVAERLASIADDACRADQGYFALHPGDQFKVRRFIPREDTRVNSLNDHRGEPTWTMMLTFRCEIPRHDGGQLA